MKQLKNQIKQITSNYFNIKYEEIPDQNDKEQFQPYIQERDKLGRLPTNYITTKKELQIPFVKSNKKFIFNDEKNYSINEEQIKKRINEFKQHLNANEIQRKAKDNSMTNTTMFFTKKSPFIEMYSSKSQFSKPEIKQEKSHLQFNVQPRLRTDYSQTPPLGYYKITDFSQTNKGLPAHQFSKVERKFDWQNLKWHEHSSFQVKSKENNQVNNSQDDDRLIEQELKKSLKNSKLIQLRINKSINQVQSEQTNQRLEIQLSDFDAGSMKKLNLQLHQLRKVAKKLKSEIQFLSEKQLQSLNK